MPDQDEEAPLIRDGHIHGTDPRSGEALETVRLTDAADLPALAERARAASRELAAKSVHDRSALLGKFRDALMARGDEFVAALSAETGKPEAEAWLHEVLPVADLAAYWSVEGPEHLVAVEPVLDAVNYPGKRAVVERVPRGVIALITPWNFPVAIPLRTLFPALLAGNGVLFKPSEYTARCGGIIAEAASEVYGPDLVHVVQGGGSLGAAVIAGGVDAVIFTGSVATGRKVAHGAADALIPVSLELGGKDAAIVLDDAPLERAARGILWGAMVNAGQNCAGIERVYATKKIAGPLKKRLAELADAMVAGRDYGPLVTAEQLAIVERHVAAAKEAGAEVLAGGARLEQPGRWFAPTVLSGVPADNDSICEETFGPVVPITEVADEAAAIEAANASRFGLTASVWTKKRSHGEKIARQLRAGVVMVNNHGFTGAIPALPWSGVGDSGYGVTNSPHALDVLTRPRAVLVDASRGKAELWWHPYTPALVQIAKSLVTLKRGGAGLSAKLKAIGSLLTGFLKRWKV